MTNTAHNEGVALNRTLGLLDITMIGVGAMIGAGIFVLTGANIEHRVVSAETPLAGILAEAEQSDMVVIGASEKRGFRHLLLGNVAQQVAEKADCPVLIVRRRARLSGLFSVRRCCGRKAAAATAIRPSLRPSGRTTRKRKAEPRLL